MNYYWDWDRAEAEFQHALDDAEDQASAREWYALLRAARGRIREARRQTVRAVELEPMLPNPLVQQAHILYYAGEYEQARPDIQQALTRNPTFVRAHLFRALIDLQTGREQEALDALMRFRGMTADPEPVLVAVLGYAQARMQHPAEARAQLQWLQEARARGQYLPPELLALVYVALGQHDAALAELERARREHSSGLVYIKVEPLVAELRNYPRFQALVDAVH